MSSLTSPYGFEFFRNGVLLATMAGALCAMVGVFVVQRGMSSIGHGLSHSLFGGFAASALLGVNLLLGAGVWGLVSAFMILRMSRRPGVTADAAIGVITTASFALGLMLLSLGPPTRVNVDAALFGSILGVSSGDVAVVAAVCVLAVVFVVSNYRRLLFVTFDADVAAASGVRVGGVDMAFMAVLSATILSTLNVMGVTLVAAGLVMPAVTARILTHSFPRVLALATALGAASGFVGMNLSYHLDVPSGPAIVLVAAAGFVAALTVSALRTTTPRRLLASA